MKKTLCIVWAFLLVITVICGSVYLHNKSIDTSYQQTVNLIKNGFYEDALTEFEKANPDVLDREDFGWDMKRQAIGKCYKDTIYLYSYALARLEYESENRDMSVVHDDLEWVPEDYNGALCEEIHAWKEEVKPQYEAYLAEQERKAEEAKAERQKQENAYLAELKNKIPYKGMSERYIHVTAAGKADEHESKYVKGNGTKSGYDCDKYYWYAEKQKDMVLFVECQDGKVTDVIKYYERVYWTADGKPKFGATRSKTTTKSRTSSKREDPYHVNDYSDPENFYDDNYDDFFDYEDAEDYYHEHYND